MNRRDFLRGSALSTATMTIAGSALSNSLSRLSAPFIKQPIGLGMFTLFGTIEKDVPGTLKKLKEIGVQELESAFSTKGGYYGMTAKEFAKTTKDLGLQWRSHHVLGNPFKMPEGQKLPAGMENMQMPKDLTNNAQELVDDVASGGIKNIVCASIDISSGDAVKKAIDVLNKASELAQKAGLTLSYHNHDKEFMQVDGIVPHEQFLAQLSPKVKFELDLAWVSKAGVDPVELFKKNPGRYPMWHVKDFDKDFKNLQPVGKGVIDFKRIFAEAKTAGLQHAFIEHDFPADPFASISDSVTYLKTIK